MKIAIAAGKEKGGKIFEHFGRAPFFQIYELNAGNVSYIESRKNPKNDSHGHFHESILPILEDVDMILSSGMGSGAHAHIIAEGKKLILTNPMDIEEALKLHARGELKNDPSLVHSHSGHDHGHHHRHVHIEK